MLQKKVLKMLLKNQKCLFISPVEQHERFKAAPAKYLLFKTHFLKLQNTLLLLCHI